jgi:hypothetical protein
VLPQPKFAVEAHAFRNLGDCNEAPLNLLARFASSLARPRQVFGSVLLAPGLFILPAFSSGDFFLTLSHRFLKLSYLLA